MPRTALAETEPKLHPAQLQAQLHYARLEAEQAELRHTWLERAKALPTVQDRAAQCRASPELITAICEALAMGTPMQHAVRAAGLDPKTVQLWAQADPELSKLLSDAVSGGVHSRVRRLHTDPDPKWASWLLSRHHASRDDFKPPDYGAQRHSRVEIAFNFSREQGQAGVTLEHNAQLPEPSE